MANDADMHDIVRRDFVKGIGATAAIIGATGKAVGRSDNARVSRGDADLVIYNAEIQTVDSNDRVAEAMAVKDGRIQDVGNNRSIRNRFVGDDTETLDLEGHTVIPGLQDSHIHFQGLGDEIENFGILTDAITHDDIVERLEETVEEKGFVVDEDRDELYEDTDIPNEWVRATRWDEINIQRAGVDDGVIPRWELEEKFEYADHPVHALRSYRGEYVNTAVFNLMGIYDDDPETWPDWWTEDPEEFTFEEQIVREERTIETVDGETITEEVPTGVFIGTSGRRPDLLSPPPTDMGPIEDLDSGSDEILSLGVTSICDAAAWHGEHFREAREELFPLRIKLWHGTFVNSANTPQPVIENVLSEHVDRGWFGGDRWFKQDGCKFHHDGGDVVRSGAVSEPYAEWEDKEGEPNFGQLFDKDWVRESMTRVPFEKGYRLHNHGVGDVAVRQIIDIFKRYIELLREEYPDADPRFTLQHATLAKEEDVRVKPKETPILEDMAEYDIIATPQGVLIWQFGDAFIEQNGEERAKRSKALRSMIDAGVTVANSSDFSVADHNPGNGFYGSMTRKALGSGEVIGEDERLSATETLRTWTYNGAYASHEEDIRGSLESGKVADFVVLDLDSWQDVEDDPELLFEWEDLVKWTVVEGITGYQDDSFVRDTDEDPSRPPDEELPDYIVGDEGSSEHAAGDFEAGQDGDYVATTSQGYDGSDLVVDSHQACDHYKQPAWDENGNYRFYHAHKCCEPDKF